jgi:HD-GYP domain-containing protein (c-di-GMP phosphodiesterase class II)
MNITSVDHGADLSAPAPAGKADVGFPTVAEHPRSSSADLKPPTDRPGSGDRPGLVAGGSLSLSDFLNRLIDSRLLSLALLEQFLKDHPHLAAGSTEDLARALINQGLLTDFQLARIYAGQTFGLVLGNYRIVERLGAGGMGVVYKAEHIHMKRAVAIKVLVAEEDDRSIFLQRFYSEMQATAVLSHPNIVLAFDAGEMAVPNSANQVLHYLVMEYVQGQNLEQQVLQCGPLSVEVACDYIRQAASGLQHAYEHGLVHRDIKPSNLFVTPQNQVKILDFGLARLCRRRHTEAHAMLGSIDYMAPEQARDARSVDIRADIYGLGGTLYWLLSGRKPFPGERSPIEELLARQNEPPRPLRSICPTVPQELEAVVQQMMALDPGDRYPTPLAVLSALTAFLERTRRTGPARPSTLVLPATAGASPAPASLPADDLLAVNQQLEQALRLRDADLHRAQDVLIFAMARMAELRGLETGAHLLRMQAYVRCLAEEAMRLPTFAGRIDDSFVRMLERCVLLHDIGKVAIPDHILLKPGKLEPEERSVMESHTVVGGEILSAVARQHGAPLAFLQMATDIARHHHERFDGSGYPGGLAGEAIPLSARIVTIADVYDALRSKLVYKPGLAHGPARRLILESHPGHFEPALLVAFRNCEANFDQIFAQTRD